MIPRSKCSAAGPRDHPRVHTYCPQQVGESAACLTAAGSPRETATSRRWRRSSRSTARCSRSRSAPAAPPPSSPPSPSARRSPRSAARPARKETGTFWTLFGLFLDPFWTLFGPCLDPFWTLFGLFLGALAATMAVGTQAKPFVWFLLPAVRRDRSSTAMKGGEI